MTNHLYFPYTSTYSSTRHNTNKKHNIHHTPYTNILRHSMAKNTIFNNGHFTTNIPTDLHTITTTVIKTNMLHIHTSIASRHLVTRGNNKILRTPPPHISSSEEILPRHTRRTLAQHMHTQARVQQRNTYKHTYIKFLPGQNKTISH